MAGNPRNWAWSLRTLFDPAPARPPKAAQGSDRANGWSDWKWRCSTVLLVVAALLGREFFPGHECRAGLCCGSHSHRRSNTARFAVSNGRATRIVSSAGARKDRDASRCAVRGADQLAALKAQVWGDAISKEGDTRPRAERPPAHYRFVSEHYFETMGVALRQGRFPTSRDRPQSSTGFRKRGAQGLAGRESDREADPERPQARVGGGDRRGRRCAHREFGEAACP